MLTGGGNGYKEINELRARIERNMVMGPAIHTPNPSRAGRKVIILPFLLVIVSAVLVSGVFFWPTGDWRAFGERGTLQDAPCGSWHLLDHSEVYQGALQHGFSQVAAVGKGDVWFAGQGPGFAHLKDGHMSIVRSNMGIDFTDMAIFDLEARAPDDIWAVGEKTQSEFIHSLIYHWNGSAWKEIAAPEPAQPKLLDTDIPLPPIRSAQLSSVAPIAADDVWVAGYYEDIVSRKPLIAHWDGGKFSITQVSALDGTDVMLKSVVALSHNDVWAFGNLRNGTGLDRIMVLHWDGSTWRAVKENAETTPLMAVMQLEVAKKTPNGDIWVMGENFNGVASAVKDAETEEWKSYQGPAIDATVFSLAAININDVWAVGVKSLDHVRTDASEPSYNLALTMHWDGATWKEIESPSQQGSQTLRSVAADNKNSIWTLGWSTDNWDSFDNIIAHYSGCP